MKDANFLNLALKQAKIQKGFCAPNPAVGSLIVDSHSNILSKAFHRGAGLPHAEIEALKALDHKIPPNSVLYVTLEPCCHWGKTPPCVEAIIQTGLKRVVYAYEDPNPLVSGKGAHLLRQAGIQCDHIPLDSINAFYESYQHWHRTKKPFVTAKIALSLNGTIAGASGQPVQITGKELLEFTHLSRKASDAILTSVNTVIADDPQLNVRIKNAIFAKPVYVLDRHLNIPLTAKLFHTASKLTLFHGKNIDFNVRAQLSSQGAHCIEVDETTLGLNLGHILTLIGQQGIHDLWVETGGKCFASLVEKNLLQRAYIYISLRWLEHGKIAFPEGISLDSMLQTVRWRSFGRDVLCDMRFQNL